MSYLVGYIDKRGAHETRKPVATLSEACKVRDHLIDKRGASEAWLLHAIRRTHGGWQGFCSLHPRYNRRAK
jgi:hypothetical protein